MLGELKPKGLKGRVPDLYTLGYRYIDCIKLNGRQRFLALCSILGHVTSLHLRPFLKGPIMIRTCISGRMHARESGAKRV